MQDIQQLDFFSIRPASSHYAVVFNTPNLSQAQSLSDQSGRENVVCCEVTPWVTTHPENETAHAA